MPSLSDFDMDENLINTVNSKYYDMTELKNVQKTNESFSIFHTNLRSLSANLDELHLLLCFSKMTFDVIGISETKEQVGKGFLTQFIVLNKFDIDYKTFSYAKRDYSKFD